jgi:hypothetical protein
MCVHLEFKFSYVLNVSRIYNKIEKNQKSLKNAQNGKIENAVGPV